MGEPTIRNSGIRDVTFGERVPVQQPVNLYGCTIGDRVSIWTGATILPVRMCDGMVVGAGAVVTKDIGGPDVYVGNPARLLCRLPEDS